MKKNITEVELGSPDYTVVPLNSREKSLLRLPSASHYHKLLLDLIDTVRIISRGVRRDSVGWTSGAPYDVFFEYGWDRHRSAAFLLKAAYKIRLDGNGRVCVDDKRTEVIEGPGLVACLYHLDRIYEHDVKAAMKTLSTVSVHLENRTRALHRELDQYVAGDRFRRVVHRWIASKMKAEMVFDLKLILERYPAHALSECLNALVVEEVHDL